MIASGVKDYNARQSDTDREICDRLAGAICAALPDAENKIWHAHPVWFLDDNPIVGYGKLKAGVRLMFWSGASFDEELLRPGTGKFKDASIIYTPDTQIDECDLGRWLEKARDVQWDYGNLVKRKGVLKRLK